MIREKLLPTFTIVPGQGGRGMAKTRSGLSSFFTQCGKSLLGKLGHLPSDCNGALAHAPLPLNHRLRQTAKKCGIFTFLPDRGGASVCNSCMEEVREWHPEVAQGAIPIFSLWLAILMLFLDARLSEDTADDSDEQTSAQNPGLHQKKGLNMRSSKPRVPKHLRIIYPPIH